MPKQFEAPKITHKPRRITECKMGVLFTCISRICMENIVVVPAVPIQTPAQQAMKKDDKVYRR